MKELEDLTDIEKAVLLACCDANGFSLGSHVPIEAIKRKLHNIQAKYLNKAEKKLLANGFIVRHPTRNQMTYQLTKKGLEAGNKLKEDFQK
jgi:predicted transcriptional regulator